MKFRRMLRGAWSLIALLSIVVYGLSFWLLRPVDLHPVAQLRGAASIVGNLLLIAAVAGIAAMATVQFWKGLFQPRSIFHASELEALFGEHMVQILGLAAPGGNLSYWPDKSRALDHLLDNPTEVVMGQIRSTADYILLRPEGFDVALGLLAGAAGKPALQKYLMGREKRLTNMSSDNAPIVMGRSNEALVELRFFVEQHLNLIHVRLKERWRWRVRVVAVVVAGLSGLLTVILSDLGPAAKVSVVFAAAIWGGFISWVARDLVALVERRRV